MDSLKIRLFFLIAFLSFHINALSTSQIVNDSINRYYGKAMSAHEKGDYKEMFVNLCIFIRNQTDTTSYRLKDAYYHLGHLYAHAHYVEQNVDSAVYCLKKASSYGSNKASRFLFNIYYYSNYNRVNKQEALKWLKMSASQGDIKSLYELGELYDFGKTVQLKDTSITTGYSENGKIRYVRNAATQTKSTISIPGLVTNKRTAYEYYEKALDFNYQITNQKVGYYEVAVAYMDGTFFDKNYSKALEYLRNIVPSFSELSSDLSKYSNPKDADTLWRLSILYRFGLGTIDNEIKADEYLKFAAQCGHEKALNALSIIESK